MELKKFESEKDGETVYFLVLVSTNETEYEFDLPAGLKIEQDAFEAKVAEYGGLMVRKNFGDIAIFKKEEQCVDFKENYLEPKLMMEILCENIN